MSDRHPLFWLWLAVAGAAAYTMWAFSGQETIPYHLAWIGLALAYDREVWSLRLTVIAVSVFTLVTGGVLMGRASEGVVGWQETAEIPLMASLLLLVMWNVRRRQRAMAALSTMVERERAQAAMRERLSRLTSHEMRTPATIASGYTELLLQRETDPDRRSDLEVIRSELARLVLTSDRVVRMIRMPEQDHRQQADIKALLEETVQRWHVLAERTWVVETEPLSLYCSADRVRACLDTLLENAVRYTEPGDIVRVIGRRHGDEVIIGVADSGPGLEDRVAQAVNGRHPLGEDPQASPDPKSQTGLGLMLVQAVAAARGGRLVAGRAAEGGALLLMVVPEQVPREPAALLASPVTLVRTVDPPLPAPVAVTLA